MTIRSSEKTHVPKKWPIHWPRGAAFLACLRSMLLLGLAGSINAADLKPETLDPTYNHDKWVTMPKDITFTFRAYFVSFDGLDDNDGDGTSDAWGQPEFVSYEIHAVTNKLARAPARPITWIYDKVLYERGICPKDDTYKHSGYDRGHMCQKFIAFRLGPNADWNTHTTLNACPQNHVFNDGIWGDMEVLTQDWADKYGKIWVICGPIFTNRKVTETIGDGKEMKIGVPDAFFKIVIKEGQGQKPDVLAFRYSHRPILPKKIGQKKVYLHEDYSVSVDQVEAETGLDFLTVLPDAVEKEVEGKKEKTLWERK